jgi:hypothetical protein
MIELPEGISNILASLPAVIYKGEMISVDEVFKDVLNTATKSEIKQTLSKMVQFLLQQNLISEDQATKVNKWIMIITYDILDNSEMKEYISYLNEQIIFAIQKNGIKVSDIEEIVKYYIRSIDSAIWITDKKWTQIKDKYIEFVHKFFPNAEIYQREDAIIPRLPDILDFLERRLILRGLMIYDGKKGSTKEAKIVMTEISRLLEKYPPSEHIVVGVSPYLATIDLGGIGGDLAVVWRTGTVYWAISGDYDIREEALINFLTKAYFAKYGR